MTCFIFFAFSGNLRTQPDVQPMLVSRICSVSLARPDNSFTVLVNER